MRRGRNKHKGYSLNSNGYKVFQIRTINNGGRILEHRKIMQDALGRKLLPKEIVHHINGDKLDNRIENLVLMNNSYHSKIHCRKKTVNDWKKDVDERTGAGRPRRMWEKTEIDYLRKHYRELRIEDIAIHLGRSRGSVVGELSRLHLVCGCKWKKSHIFRNL